VRYADDVVLGFQYESDARRLRIELDERLSNFGLELHPEKTRLVRFGRFASRDAALAGERGPGTFEFLGFTHMGAIMGNGRFQLVRRTSMRRMRVTLKSLRGELMRNRHRPIPEQGAWLRRVVQGYFQYYAVRWNTGRLCAFRTQLVRSWLHALRRRSQRQRITWRRMDALANRWLPLARVLHPWPEERFFANTRGKSPVR
jgi:hypothetical protein